MSWLRWLKFLLWRITGQFPDFKRRGRFSGEIMLIYRSPTDFMFVPNVEKPFRFERGSDPFDFKPTGEVIEPGAMETDGGSVPRVAELVGLNRLTYFQAYLVHDWEFDQHHQGKGTKTLEDVNATLCEAIYTLQMDGKAAMNFFHIRLVYDGVASPIGQDVWDGAWLSKRTNVDNTLPDCHL